MKLAEILEIQQIINHPNADKLEIAKIFGWLSVVKKGEFKAGDKIIFVTVDTVMKPAEWNAFLHDKHDPTKPFRVKTVRLRGQVSQGIIFPLAILGGKADTVQIGDDVAEIIGVSKYEKPEGGGGLKVISAGNFPTHLVQKTDEDNVQRYTSLLEELKEAIKKTSGVAEASMKMDGSSHTSIKKGQDFTVASRNLAQKEGSSFYDAANKFKMQWVLEEFESFIKEHFDLDEVAHVSIQSEMCGPGIQSNPIGLTKVQLYVFNMFFFCPQTFRNVLIPRWMMEQFFAERDIKEKTELEIAPLVKNLTEEDLTLPNLQYIANELKYPNGKIAEGIVIRPSEPTFSETQQKFLSMKLINQNYDF